MKTSLIRFALVSIATLVSAGCGSVPQASLSSITSDGTRRGTTTSPTQAVHTSPWIKYENHTWGLELQYPDDWTVEDLNQLEHRPGYDNVLTGIFAISKQIPTLDQYGDQVSSRAQFSIAAESIPQMADLQHVEQEISGQSNYKIDGMAAYREIQDNTTTYIIYTTITFVANRTLYRINYSWAPANGDFDANANEDLQKQISDTCNRILASVKLMYR